MVGHMLQNSRIQSHICIQRFILIFNKIYLISTINIFTQQYTFAFNFNPGYFYSTTNIYVQLKREKLYYSTKKIYLFNFNLHYLYSTKIFIQLQASLFLFNKVKFPDIPTNIHSTNLPIPTPADLQTLSIQHLANHKLALAWLHRLPR